ncbi:MAG: MBL fold metallo-hydrolase [Planctomycetaceae bacterium]|jgi:phosphoribosyl 1,2-cyclic phosphodiesterase|nr:MBL fold metallo-hydrolase [Planctomycetaceae bacterium]
MISFSKKTTQETMRIVSLQSGSNGNCIFVETQKTRLLFDAGISAKRAKERLEFHGVDACSIDALLISHDHYDHAGNMGVFSRKFKLPVWATEQTYQVAGRKKHIGEIEHLCHFTSGETLQIGDVRIETIRTPHDAADGVVFIVDNGHVRFGIMTDLGHPFHDLKEAVQSLDAVLLESNYDPHELKYCDYPEETKARIKGKGGHISNEEAAKLLDSAKSRLRWACLGHISAESNHPDLVCRTHEKILGESLPFYIASRYEVSDMFVL